MQTDIWGVFKLSGGGPVDDGRPHRYNCTLCKLLVLLGQFLPKWSNIPHM